MTQDKRIFKAFIRVVKSIANGSNNFLFDSVEIIREPIIEAKDKAEVKQILIDKYPQFFQNGKIYERETKDKAQFFYVVIFELWNNEIELINKGEWSCYQCKQVHKNQYEVRPNKIYKEIFRDFLFCPDSNCANEYKKEYFKHIDLLDDANYINKNSLNYIYKITEKSSNKCYIGKTKNAPFFRWWNHLTKSSSPFGLYLQKTKLQDWIFEVIEELPSNISETEIFKIESQYIKMFDSINNGFNTLISNKNVLNQ